MSCIQNMLIMAHVPSRQNRWTLLQASQSFCKPLMNQCKCSSLNIIYNKKKTTLTSYLNMNLNFNHEKIFTMGMFIYSCDIYLSMMKTTVDSFIFAEW